MTGKQIIIAASLLVFVFILVALGLTLSYDAQLQPENVQVTNVTDTSLTLVWTSSVPYKGQVMYKPGESFVNNTITARLNGYLTANDDRAYQLSSEGEYEYQSANDKDRYTHHVTLRDLEPESKYTILINGNILAYSPTQAEIKTKSLIEDLALPDVAYGAVNADSVDDTVVLLSSQQFPEEIPEYYSTTVSDSGTYTIDVGKLKQSMEDVLDWQYYLLVRSGQQQNFFSSPQDGYNPFPTLTITAQSSALGMSWAPKALAVSNECVTSDREGTITTDGSNARLRSDSNTNSDVLASIPNRSPVTVHSHKSADNQCGGSTSVIDVWYNITFAGVTGYVRGDLISLGAATDLPRPENPSPGETNLPGATICSDNRAVGSGGFGCSAAEGRTWLGSSGHCNICSQGQGVRLNCGACDALINPGDVDAALGTERPVVLERTALPTGVTTTDINTPQAYCAAVISGNTSWGDIIQNVGAEPAYSTPVSTRIYSGPNPVAGQYDLNREIVYTNGDRYACYKFTSNLPQGGTQVLDQVRFDGVLASTPDMHARAPFNQLAVDLNLATPLFDSDVEYGDVVCAVAGIVNSGGAVTTAIFNNRDLVEGMASGYTALVLGPSQINIYSEQAPDNIGFSHLARYADRLIGCYGSAPQFVPAPENTAVANETPTGDSGWPPDLINQYLEDRSFLSTEYQISLTDCSGKTADILRFVYPDERVTNTANSVGVGINSESGYANSQGGFDLGPQVNDSTNGLGACSLVSDEPPGYTFGVYCLDPAQAIGGSRIENLRCGERGSAPGQPLAGNVLAQSADSTKSYLEVDSSGRYDFYSNGEVFAQRDIALKSDSAAVFFFTDANGNGKLDSDEQLLSSVAGISLEARASLYEYKLNSGWNLIHVPLVDDTGDVDTAAELLKSWQDAGINVVHVARFHNNKFEIFTLREGGTEFSRDFKLVPGDGLFVFNLGEAGTVRFVGKKLGEALPLQFNTGWNLVGFFSPSKSYDTESLIKAMQAQGIDANILSEFESGKYTSVVSDSGVIYGNNFDVTDKRGYFVRVDSITSKTFTP